MKVKIETNHPQFEEEILNLRRFFRQRTASKTLFMTVLGFNDLLDEVEALHCIIETQESEIKQLKNLLEIKGKDIGRKRYWYKQGIQIRKNEHKR